MSHASATFEVTRGRRLHIELVEVRQPRKKDDGALPGVDPALHVSRIAPTIETLARQFEPADLPATDVLVYEAAVGELDEEVDQFTIAFEKTDVGADLCLRWITTEVRVPISLP